MIIIFLIIITILIIGLFLYIAFRFNKIKQCISETTENNTLETFNTDPIEIPLTKDNWITNTTGPNLEYIIKYNDKSTTSIQNIELNMCIWSCSGYYPYYSGEIYCSKSYGYGEYSIHIRGTPGGVYNFYLCLPRGIVQQKEIDFELTTSLHPNDPNIWLLNPFTNIFNEGEGNVDNQFKKEDGTCNATPFDSQIPFSAKNTPYIDNSGNMIYNGSLKYTIGLHKDRITWKIENSDNVQQYYRECNFVNKTDKSFDKNNKEYDLSAIHKDGTSTGFSELQQNYSDVSDIHPYFSFFNTGSFNYINCEEFDENIGYIPNLCSECETEKPYNGWQAVYYGPFIFTPDS